MNRSASKLTVCRVAFSLFMVGISSSLATAQASSSSTTSTAAKPAAQADPGATTAAPTAPASSSNTASKSAAGKPSASEIAAAKASGKVWVNTESRVYHKGGRWYGKTKAGKFMTEAEAKAAGYKSAQKE
jgi:hypothetical protein